MNGLMLKKFFLLFALEGALLQFSGAINGFANNLFATNLGATDEQIALIQTIPNLVAMALMLPMGFLSDRARSSRTIPMVMLTVMITGYVLISLVPMAGEMRIALFFVALAFTVGGQALYNAQWQSFFGDVVPIENRNNVLTIRNRFMFLVGIIAPILCGVFMGMAQDPDAKLTVLQVFFIICILVSAAQLFTVHRIETPRRDGNRESTLSLKETGNIISGLLKDPSFHLFFVPMVLFYMAWQIDWSMWYIGQVRYLELSEADMAIQNGVFNIGQLIAVGVLSGLARKKDVEFTFLLAPIGLMTCPLIMMLCSLLPQAMHMPAFTLLTTVMNAGQCATNLCVVQMLLRVSPARGRGVAVSFFTLTTTLTNSFMPVVGVQIYTLLGSDRAAFYGFNSIVAVLRIAVILIMVWRYCKLKRSGVLVPEG